MQSNLDAYEYKIDIHVDCDLFSLDILGESHGQTKRRAIINAIQGMATLAEAIEIKMKQLNSEYVKDLAESN